MVFDDEGGLISSSDIEVFGAYSEDPSTLLRDCEDGQGPASRRRRLFGSHLGELVMLVREPRRVEAMDEEFSKRLLLLKDLTHSNILSYRGVYINDSEGTRAVDIVYLFPEGGTLHSLLFGRDIPLGWNFKLRLARGAATGVKHLHDNNVIHNDVRPYNFALDSEYNCMLLDFHFAMQLHDVFCGEMLVGYGDPAYMSPECLNNDACCGSSDIFGLGLVMWELASQKQSSLVPRADDHTVNFERMRSLLPPSTPASFIELIRQCLLPERELRPAVEDIVEWLDSLMEEYTVDDDYPVPALPSLPFSAHTRASTDEGATRLNPLFGRNISSDEAHPASPESPGTRIPAPFASTGRLSVEFYRSGQAHSPSDARVVPRFTPKSLHSRRSSSEAASHPPDGYIIGTRRPDGDVRKQGYMLKKIRGLPYWKKRWFVLDGLKLGWCHTEADAVHQEKLHSFELTHCIVEEVGNGASSQFQVYKDLRRYKPPPATSNGPKQNLEMRLGCSNRQEAEDWIEALITTISVPRCKVCRSAVDVDDTTFDVEEDHARVFCSIECARFLKAVNGRGLLVAMDVNDNQLELLPKAARRLDWEHDMSGAYSKDRERLTTMSLPESMHEWLDGLKLSPFLRGFEAAGYESILHIQLVGFTDEDLDFVGVLDFKHREKLRKAAAELKAAFYMQNAPFESEMGDLSVQLPRRYAEPDIIRRRYSRNKWRRSGAEKPLAAAR